MSTAAVLAKLSTKDRLLSCSATALARLVREGEVSPTELLELHLARVLEVNARLNAIVVPLYDEARELAHKATDYLAKRSVKPEELPPLFGVPCTIKDTFAYQGQPWTGGVYARRDFRALQNATVVQRLLDAGAIPMGITNVPEAGMWYETYNQIYGRTSNPHDTRRISGGSSGGEAAMIGAGGSPFGIGSDIGGSIRLPANFCGIVGHKPTPGLVPNTGHYPDPVGELRRYSVVGPLARRVEDLETVLRVVAGKDGVDQSLTYERFEQQPIWDPMQTRVYYFEDGQFGSTLEARHAVRVAVDTLEARGMRVEPFRPRLLDRGLEIWFANLEAVSSEPFARIITGGAREISVLRELALSALRRSDHTFPAILLAAIEKVSRHLPSRLKEVRHLRVGLKRDIEEKLGPKGVLICPTFPRPAPLHNEPLLRPLEWISTGIFNILEMPVTCLPVSRTVGDIPVGVQIVGREGADDVTLKVARLLEEDLGGWRVGRGSHAV